MDLQRLIYLLFATQITPLFFASNSFASLGTSSSSRQGLFGHPVAADDYHHRRHENKSHFCGNQRTEAFNSNDQGYESEESEPDDRDTRFSDEETVEEELHQDEAIGIRRNESTNTTPLDTPGTSRYGSGQPPRKPRPSYPLKSVDTNRNRTTMSGKGGSQKRGARGASNQNPKKQKRNQQVLPNAGRSTRSDTEKTNRIEELERQLKEKEEALQQKEKAANQGVKNPTYQPYPVEHSKHVEKDIRETFREKVWPYQKFLKNDSEVKEALKSCLEGIDEWNNMKLGTLDPEDLDAQLDKYLPHYRQVVTGLFNKHRSDDQSAVRKVWLEHRMNQKNAEGLTAAQFLKVAQRIPKYLVILDEEGGTDEENQANQEANVQNQKYRDRLVLFFDEILPKVLVPTAWSIQNRQEEIISDFVYNETNKDVVPVAVEAMAILYMENNQDKWEFQATTIKKTGAKNWEEWKKTASEKEKKDIPHPKYSDSACGNKEFGGWSPEGRKRFRTICKLIRMGREQEETKEIEEVVRDLIQKKHEHKPKPKEKPLPQIVDDDESEDEGDIVAEECYSDEEVEYAKQHQYLTDGEKKKKEEDRKKEEEARKKEEEAQKLTEQEAMKDGEVAPEVAEGAHETDAQAATDKNQQEQQQKKKKGTKKKGPEKKKPSAAQRRSTRGKKAAADGHEEEHIEEGEEYDDDGEDEHEFQDSFLPN